MAAVLISKDAWAGDYVDTRLNFTITDENLLVKPGETNPSVPGVHIGQPNSLGILFFDNYDTRYTGYENLTHLVIYKSFGNDRVTAEAAYVLRLLQFTDVNLSSIDDGSYIRMQFWFDKHHAEEGGSKNNLALTVFPLSSNRMRLGFSYRISWGGDPMFFKLNPDIPIGTTAFVTNTQPAPGAKLQLSGDRYYVYVGVKNSQILDRNPNVNEQVAVWAGLAGFGVDLVRNHFRLEGNGGYFDRGTNPLFFGSSVGSGGMTFTSFPVATFGASMQLSVFDGISPTQSVDYALYRNDPMVSAGRYFTRPVYSPGFNWLISTEWTGTGTILQDVDHPTTTKIQPAYAGDVNLRAQMGHFRVKADFEMRSLSFILQNQPSLVPYQDFPNGATTNAEIFGAVGFDYLFQRIGLTIGPTLGIERPSSFTPPPGQTLQGPLMGNTGGTLATSATIVVRNEGDLSILPDVDRNGNRVQSVPLVAAKLEAREDFLEWFACILQIYYQYDGNQTSLTKADDGTFQRSFNQPNQLGFNLTLQARY